MSHTGAPGNERAVVIDSATETPSASRVRTLDDFLIQAGCVEGVALQSLPPGSVLCVTTRNSRYQFIVLDPIHRRVMVHGGSAFRERQEARLEGTTSGGSAVKLGWIGVGLRLELSCGDRRVTTSPVYSVTIESVPPPSDPHSVS